MNIVKHLSRLLAVGTLSLVSVLTSHAAAQISYVSSSNSQLEHLSTIDDNGTSVFVFKGISEGDSATISFSNSGDCPLIATAGGAKFDGTWDCSDGTISATVINKGGMSFGPATDANAGSFYLLFSNPPPPPGSDTAPTALAGIQFSLFGDIESWDFSGEPTASGASFGVSLTGPVGGDQHFLMDIPPAAVEFLGGVLGITIGGKPYPSAFSTVNEDGSVSLGVDITNVKASSLLSPALRVSAYSVTKKIVAGARELGISALSSTVKPGGSITYAVCSGTEFSAGDKVPVKFTVGGKANKSLKAFSFVLGTDGCASKKIKLAKSISGSIVSQITYKSKKAKTTVKVSK